MSNERTTKRESLAEKKEKESQIGTNSSGNRNDLSTTSVHDYNHGETNFIVEYELPENMGSTNLPQLNSESVVENDVPRFEDFRHPYAKFFVNIMAILTITLLIYFSCVNLTKQYSNVLCFLVEIPDHRCSEEYITTEMIIELFIRFYFEIIIPLIMILSFFVINILFLLTPRWAANLSHPTPKFTPIISILIIYYWYCSVSTSLSILPSLASVLRIDILIEYLKVTSLSICWMIGFINIHVFSKLCLFNHVRVRELIEMNNVEQENFF